MNKVMLLPLLMANVLFAVDYSKTDERVALGEFIVMHMQKSVRNEDDLSKRTSEESLSSQEIIDIRQLANETLKDELAKYVNNVAETCESLIDTWFEHVRNALGCDTFSERYEFIELWNQALRNRLDISAMREMGNTLRGYLDALDHESLARLKREIYFVLADAEDEKRTEDPKPDEPEYLEIAIDGYELVFKKPVSVKGSHEKYLYRDKNSDLVFKSVIVRKHGAKKSTPKTREARNLGNNLKNNYDRKLQFAAAKTVNKKEVSSVVNQYKKPVRQIVKGDLAVRLHNYKVSDLSDNIIIKNYKDKDIKIEKGQAYYKYLSKDVQAIIDLAYIKYFDSAIENLSWLNSDHESGKYLFCYNMIADQENKLKSQTEAEEKQKPKTETRDLVLVQQAPQPKIKQPKAKRLVGKQPAPVKANGSDELARNALRDENARKLLEMLDAESVYIEDVIEFIKNTPEININYQNDDGETAIFIALQVKNMEIISSIIKTFKNKLNLNLGNKNGETPLTWAAAAGEVEIVKYLLKNGANLYAVNPYGTNALYEAACAGKIGTLEVLIEESSNGNKGRSQLINVQLSTSAGALVGYTALMASVFSNSPDLIGFLLKAGAKIGLSSPEGETALTLAIKHGRLRAAQALWQYKSSYMSNPKVNKAVYDAAVELFHSKATTGEILRRLGGLKVDKVCLGLSERPLRIFLE